MKGISFFKIILTIIFVTNFSFYGTTINTSLALAGPADSDDITYQQILAEEMFFNSYTKLTESEKNNYSRHIMGTFENGGPLSDFINDQSNTPEKFIFPIVSCGSSKCYEIASWKWTQELNDNGDIKSENFSTSILINTEELNKNKYETIKNDPISDHFLNSITDPKKKARIIWLTKVLNNTNLLTVVRGGFNTIFVSSSLFFINHYRVISSLVIGSLAGIITGAFFYYRKGLYNFIDNYNVKLEKNKNKIKDRINLLEQERLKYKSEAEIDPFEHSIQKLSTKLNRIERNPFINTAKEASFLMNYALIGFAFLGVLKIAKWQLGTIPAQPTPLDFTDFYLDENNKWALILSEGTQFLWDNQATRLERAMEKSGRFSKEFSNAVGNGLNVLASIFSVFAAVLMQSHVEGEPYWCGLGFAPLLFGSILISQIKNKVLNLPEVIESKNKFKEFNFQITDADGKVLKFTKDNFQNFVDLNNLNIIQSHFDKLTSQINKKERNLPLSCSSLFIK